MTVRLLAAAWTAPEVSEVTVDFQKVLRVVFILVAPPGLIDTLAQLLA